MALSTGATGQDHTTVYAPSSAYMAAVRGQTPTYDETPFLGEPSTEPLSPSYQGSPPAAPSDGFLPPLQQPSTPTYDPFLNQQQAPGVSPYAAPYGPAGPANSCCGLGPQPYRLGWHHYYDFGYLPKENVRPTTVGSPWGGSFGIVEFDSEWRYTTRAGGGSVFSTAPQFGLRLWDGPSNPVQGLPGQVYRLGWDFEYATPGEAPVSLLAGFTPSVNSDFSQQTSSDAWQFDGRLALFFNHSSYWTWVLGVTVWDRVDTFVLPYAGVIYTPSPQWEFRLLFPEARISYYMGRFYGERVWLYANAEYHVEAYEVELGSSGAKDAIQIEDWRALVGLRFDRQVYAKFIEAGWVFDRDVEFKGSTPDFEIRSGFIARAGLRY